MLRKNGKKYCWIKNTQNAEMNAGNWKLLKSSIEGIDKDLGSGRYSRDYNAKGNVRSVSGYTLDKITRRCEHRIYRLGFVAAGGPAVVNK